MQRDLDLEATLVAKYVVMGPLLNERTRRLWVALRRPSLPQLGHGAFAGAQRTGMVRTWGLTVSMACVLRWAW